jgi:hypothetical protein
LKGVRVEAVGYYKSEVLWFDSGWCHWNYSLRYIYIYSFWPQFGLGVDSSSNRNEYQEYFLGIKAAGA